MKSFTDIFFILEANLGYPLVTVSEIVSLLEPLIFIFNVKSTLEL